MPFIVCYTSPLRGISDKSSAKAKNYLEKLGVEVHINSVAIDYDGRILRFDGGSSFRSRNVIWAAGVSGDFFVFWSGKPLLK